MLRLLTTNSFAKCHDATICLTNHFLSGQWDLPLTAQTQRVPGIQALLRQLNLVKRGLVSQITALAYFALMLYCVSLIPFCNFSSTKETKSSTPGSTYSKIIPGVQGLHTQKLSLASRVYILLKNYPWHPGPT